LLSKNRESRTGNHNEEKKGTLPAKKSVAARDGETGMENDWGGGLAMNRKEVKQSREGKGSLGRLIKKVTHQQKKEDYRPAQRKLTHLQLGEAL